ncbi:OPT superfamily oligopeptide transporter [Meredithblackwellia eburnea MCA 4105]
MEEEEDSPYPEVRASVSNYDDTEMPVLTFRTLFLGIIFGCFIGGMNCFFTFRYPSPLFTPIIIQTISYPIGKFLAWLLPDREWKVPKRLQFLAGETVSFNPGPFNIKEHTAIVIMVNAAGSPLLAVNFSVTLEKFWDVHHGVGFDFLLALSTSMLGFGVAGLTRRFLVWPASLIWPQNLVYCTLFNTLHAEEDKEGGGITRYQFFKWAGTAAFFWYFFPGFIFQALSYFSFICWIKPDNVVVNQLFGVSTGLGMSMITFDWSQIAYIGNPLVVPWWAEINVFVGFVLAFWILTPALYYSNVWYTGYLPISTSGVFDRFGASYNTTAVINVGTKSLNETAYQEYSPLFLPISYAMNYGLACALTTALITHTALYHGPDIWRRLKGMRKEEEDIHIKLMRNYKEVPEWWYMLYLAGFVATAVATVVHWETEMPVWGLVVSLLFGALYVLPGGFVYAMTTQQITLNILVEMMAGYMMPGKALGNSLFKLYAIQPIGFALTFVQDLKLGHYMKLPPRVTFLLQIMGMLCSCILQVGIKVWLTRSVHDLCDPHQAAYLSCPNSRIFFSSSITWGLIGPEKQFSVGKFYNPLLWAFLAGAIAPIPLWYMGKRYPNSWYTKVSVPVMLTGCMWMPPATGINFSSWFLFGYIFQSWARRRHFRWWSKFNFTLAASLDCGTSISLIFIFCTLYLPKGGTIFLDWWGNNVFVNTADYNGVSYLTPPEEGFGPTTWK